LGVGFGVGLGVGFGVGFGVAVTVRTIAVVTLGALRTVGVALAGLYLTGATDFVGAGDAVGVATRRIGAADAFGPKTAGLSVAWGSGWVTVGVTAGLTTACAVAACVDTVVAIVAPRSVFVGVLGAGVTGAARVTGVAAVDFTDVAAPTDPTGMVNTNSIRKAIAVSRRRRRARNDLRPA